MLEENKKTRKNGSVGRNVVIQVSVLRGILRHDFGLEVSFLSSGARPGTNMGALK